MTSPTARDATLVGLLSALGAFLTWGLLAPVYFKLLGAVGPMEIVAHRVVWTVLMVGAVVLATRGPAAVVRAVGTWPRLAIFTATTALISGNWLVYIYSIVSNQLVQSSLGYYINPLVNVVLGVVFLHERLSRRQMLSVLIATAGVGSLVVSHGTLPWIALSLALSFGVYGLVRKKAAIDPMIGLLVETTLLLPAAAAYLFWLGTGGAFLTQGVGQALMLALSGPVTAVPLVLFAMAAARLKLSTIGLLQYVAPTGQLLLGVLVYGERFTTAHAIAFGCIWTALTLYSLDAIGTHRANRRAEAKAAAGD